MDRLLITGASGLLGANAVLAAIGDFHVTAVCHRQQLAHPQIDTVLADLTIVEQVERVIRDCRPDVILHAAALTDIDGCERDPKAAFQHNRDMPKAIARSAQEIGAYMVHISTDAVFDGVEGDYTEVDSPRPINTYGESKAEGEHAVLTHSPHSVVIRTNFFGWNAQDKLSLAEWFLSRLNAGEMTPGFDDVWFSPILVNQLIDFIFLIMRLRLDGVYHVAGSDCFSKFEFGKKLASIFDLDQRNVKAVPVESAGLKAPRSKMLCIDTSRITEKLGIEMPGIESGLLTFKALYDQGHASRLKSIIQSG